MLKKYLYMVYKLGHSSSDSDDNSTTTASQAASSLVLDPVQWAQEVHTRKAKGYFTAAWSLSLRAILYFLGGPTSSQPAETHNSRFNSKGKTLIKSLLLSYYLQSMAPKECPLCSSSSFGRKGSTHFHLRHQWPKGRRPGEDFTVSPRAKGKKLAALAAW